MNVASRESNGQQSLRVHVASQALIAVTAYTGMSAEELFWKFWEEGCPEESDPEYGFTVIRMKTTIELPDPLIKEAKRIALERGQTLKDVMISALESEVKRVKKDELLSWVRGTQKEFKETGWKNADQYVAEQRSGWE